MRILRVDADVKAVLTLQKGLQEDGFAVEAAATVDGAEARALALE